MDWHGHGAWETHVDILNGHVLYLWRTHVEGTNTWLAAHHVRWRHLLHVRVVRLRVRLRDRSTRNKLLTMRGASRRSSHSLLVVV